MAYQETESKDLVTTRSPNHRVVYSNTARLRMSNLDASLTFCAFVDIHSKDQRPSLVSEEQVTVFMQLHEAKKLAITLMKAISEFETQFGSIPEPKVPVSSEAKPKRISS